MLNTSVKTIKKAEAQTNALLLADKSTKWEATGISKAQIKWVKKKIKEETKPVILNDGERYVFVVYNELSKPAYQQNEQWRQDASKVAALCNENKLDEFALLNFTKNSHAINAALEGILLANYQFLKYRTSGRNGKNTLAKVYVLESSIDKKELQAIQKVAEATCLARDLVNEPLSYLTAVQLSNDLKKIGKKIGFKVEVFNKTKIKALKMGGLLAVNLGSPNPPTFNILEWKPKKAVNKKPLVLVGKGVVYDTGGLSLKPTPKSMDKMKSDMGGAAAVIGTLYAISSLKLPVHVVGLIPATENRPGGNAYAPGDVIKMHSGLNVEVLNTDAEGRMILADALSYARKYKPDLVIDLATLTGAAARAIGPEGVVVMGTAGEEVKKQISDSGDEVYERLVEFPLWEEYENYMKSDIADLKNVGGPYAGAITAGIFLKNFTDYPWLHLDIAGMAFLDNAAGYRPKNGTGVGVRLLTQFIKNKFNV